MPRPLKSVCLLLHASTGQWCIWLLHVRGTVDNPTYPRRALADLLSHRLEYRHVSAACCVHKLAGKPGKGVIWVDFSPVLDHMKARIFFR